MSTPLIQTRQLTRHFTKGHGKSKEIVEAVRGLDLTVERGELVAFLGPNGAGKSTTLRMLTTLLPPTSGTASIAGHDVVREQAQVRRHLGYVGQGNGAGHLQRGRDELVSQGRAYGLSRGDARRRAGELIEALDLGHVADRQVSTLSGGQRRRMDIALGLVHSPELIFLDEPSTGLDPQNRANLTEIVRDLHARQGSTVVLTTHYLEEADTLAQRVVVIDHGEVIADDTAGRLKSGLGDLIRLGYTDRAAASRAVELAGRLPGATTEVSAGERPAVEIRVSGGRELAIGLLGDLGRAQLPPTSVELVGPTLDDVFLDLTGRSLRETATTADTDTTPISKEEAAA